MDYAYVAAEPLIFLGKTLGTHSGKKCIWITDELFSSVMKGVLLPQEQGWKMMWTGDTMRKP